MHKVVFDTNIYVSAIRGGKVSRKLLELAFLGRGVKLYISSPILHELKEALEDLGYSRKEISRVAQEIKAHVYLIKVSHVVKVCPHPADDKIIECALSAKAKYIVTGDHHLLGLGTYKGVQILPPNQLMVLLETEGEIFGPR